MRSISRAKCILVVALLYVAVSTVIWLHISQFYSESPLEFGFVMSHFRPTMSEEERRMALTSLQIVEEACRKANITVMLYGGTLLGSYLHHGFIPWDDDVDIVVNSSDKTRFKEVLEKYEEFALDTPINFQWKFFNKSLTHSYFLREYRWPYIDIFFFEENATHVWNPDLLRFTFRKSDVFPLKQGIFEHLQFCIPYNTTHLVTSLYDVDACVSRGPTHKIGYPVSWNGVSVPCDLLRPYFPFVERTTSVEGKAVEILKVGRRVVHTVASPGLC